MRIHIVHDGTTRADAAARFVLLFARSLASRVTVIDTSSARRPTRRGDGTAEGTAALLREHGVPADVVAAEGRTASSLATAILDLVDDGGGELVVVPSPDEHVLTPLTGSTARALVRRSPVAVLVVDEAPDALRRVLVCTSVQLPHGTAALDPAIRIAGATGAAVDVLHVMSQLPRDGGRTDVGGKRHGVEWHRRHETAEGQHLDGVLELLAARGIEAHARIRHGLVVDEILQHARQQPADLVVVGAHDRASRRSWLLDDIADRVVGELARPVLVLQAPGDRAA